MAKVESLKDVQINRTSREQLESLTKKKFDLELSTKKA